MNPRISSSLLALSSVAALLVCGSPAHAQAPNGATIHFVGHLTDLSNNPINAVVDIKLRIMDQPLAGNTLFTEEHSGIDVQDGVLEFDIGTYSPLGAAVFEVVDGQLSGAGRFISLTLDGETQEMSPRFPIPVVPFAVRALLGGGAQGPQGDSGPQGEPGPQGAIGPAGAPGSQGEVGVTGPQGPTGLKGANGAAGATGSTGAPGLRGQDGDSVTTTDLVDGDPRCRFGGVEIYGASGVVVICHGAPGQDGNTGATGDLGPTGLTGPTGGQGPIGLTGAVGAIGPIGVTGAMGPQGPIGLTGAQGVGGQDGATGAQGPAGARGIDGALGPIGPKGPAGAQGLQGLAGANGTNGADGATGAQGLQGIAGADGANGATGAPGLDGSNGATGAPGATGAQGLQGIAGADGSDGTDGAAGAQGPQGLAGANGTNGADGATGAQGPQGLAGANGTNGATGAQGPTGATGPAGASTGGIAKFSNSAAQTSVTAGTTVALDTTEGTTLAAYVAMSVGVITLQPGTYELTGSMGSVVGSDAEIWVGFYNITTGSYVGQGKSAYVDTALFTMNSGDSSGNANAVVTVATQSQFELRIDRNDYVTSISAGASFTAGSLGRAWVLVRKYN